jgi:hypothetical protein
MRRSQLASPYLVLYEINDKSNWAYSFLRLVYCTINEAMAARDQSDTSCCSIVAMRIEPRAKNGS